MSEPLFRFGLIADVQYGDKPDQGHLRYRASLGKLERCVADLARRRLDFVVQLGDVIDGRETLGESGADLERVLAPLEGLGVPLVHVVGNHCLAVPRAELLPRLGLERGYRSFVWSPWRFVVVDTVELALVGRDAGDPRAREAERWLAGHPIETHPWANPWNGGLGEEQRAWLASQLEAAAAAGEHAVVLAHHPVDPDAARPQYPAWDHRDVLAVLDRVPPPRAWICGHDHRGGFHERAGVRHWIVPALLAADDESNAYAVVEAFADRLEVRGVGAVGDRTIPAGGASQRPH